MTSGENEVDRRDDLPLRGWEEETVELGAASPAPESGKSARTRERRGLRIPKTAVVVAVLASGALVSVVALATSTHQSSLGALEATNPKALTLPRAKPRKTVALSRYKVVAQKRLRRSGAKEKTIPIETTDAIASTPEPSSSLPPAEPPPPAPSPPPAPEPVPSPPRPTPASVEFGL